MLNLLPDRECYLLCIFGNLGHPYLVEVDMSHRRRSVFRLGWAMHGVSYIESLNVGNILNRNIIAGQMKSVAMTARNAPSPLQP